MVPNVQLGGGVPSHCLALGCLLGMQASENGEKNNRGMNCTAPTTYGDSGAHAAITAVPLTSAHGL